MLEILLPVVLSSTKTSEISDMTKCPENVVSQVLGIYYKILCCGIKDKKPFNITIKLTTT